MHSNYSYQIENPKFDHIGHVVATANLYDKHDRCTASHYHWKNLKCRMIIFSNSSILASPDKNEIKQVHILFNKVSNDYDRLASLFLKFALIQKGAIGTVTPEILLMCFRYTFTARIAPIWNTLGDDYLINNRDFLSTVGLQNGIKYHIKVCESSITLKLKPIKIILTHTDDKYKPGDCVRVLPSLNNAIIEDYIETISESGSFRCYKDLRRHWKNIHGYRLPEEECPYYSVRFWRGEPLTYPKICLTPNFPITTPMPKSAEAVILTTFLGCLKSKMPYFLGTSLTFRPDIANENFNPNKATLESYQDAQAVRVCTSTQRSVHQNGC